MNQQDHRRIEVCHRTTDARISRRVAVSSSGLALLGVEQRSNELRELLRNDGAAANQIKAALTAPQTRNTAFGGPKHGTHPAQRHAFTGV
jgi:hypothetical protein